MEYTKTMLEKVMFWVLVLAYAATAGPPYASGEGSNSLFSATIHDFRPKSDNERKRTVPPRPLRDQHIPRADRGALKPRSIRLSDVKVQNKRAPLRQSRRRARPAAAPKPTIKKFDGGNRERSDRIFPAKQMLNHLRNGNVDTKQAFQFLKNGKVTTGTVHGKLGGDYLDCLGFSSESYNGNVGKHRVSYDSSASKWFSYDQLVEKIDQDKMYLKQKRRRLISRLTRTEAAASA